MSPIYKLIPTLIVVTLLAIGAINYLPKQITSPDSKNDLWLRNYEQAKDLAKKQDKFLLLDFTGSDWCGWCIKLKQEVFLSTEFQNYAASHFILVEVDFPRTKQQSEAEKSQNEALMKKFNVQGFPTIIVLDSDGVAIGKTGYAPGGPSEFIKALDGIITN